MNELNNIKELNVQGKTSTHILDDFLEKVRINNHKVAAEIKHAAKNIYHKFNTGSFLLPRNSYGKSLTTALDIKYSMVYIYEIAKSSSNYCRQNSCSVYFAFAPSYLDAKYSNQNTSSIPNSYFFEKIRASAEDYKFVKTCDYMNLTSDLGENIDTVFTREGGHYSDKGYSLLAKSIHSCLRQ